MGEDKYNVFDLEYGFFSVHDKDLTHIAELHDKKMADLVCRLLNDNENEKKHITLEIIDLFIKEVEDYFQESGNDYLDLDNLLAYRKFILDKGEGHENNKKK